MKRRLVTLTLVLAVALTTGCSYFQKPEPPPPLPPIEEPKPPLKMKSEYFNSFPWGELSKPQEAGNEPDTWTYTLKEGDTLESVAEKQMGDSSMADQLASYNDLSPTKVTPGKKIVIPDPIIGVSSKIMVKHKGEKQFGTPEAFGVEFKKADQYKFRFETNVDGHLYVFRRGTKKVLYLYPERIKPPPRRPTRGRRARKPEPQPLMRESGKVKKHEPVEIPLGPKGFTYDPKKVGEQLYVFLSLKEIPSLEELKSKATVGPQDLEDVMRGVKDGEVYHEAPYHLLRITNPSEILGFKLNIDG